MGLSAKRIGEKMCPATTEQLLTRELRTPMFQEWEASFGVNCHHVMGKRQKLVSEHVTIDLLSSEGWKYSCGHIIPKFS
jgi:hypothetical protein